MTIGICARNSENIVLDAINSVIQQDFDHRLMEIVFVDDGSEDNTLQIVKAAFSEIDVPAIIFHDGWRGIGKARNTIVQNANGEYIIWLDSDEVLEKDFVRRQINLMELNPKAAIATARMKFPYEQNQVLTLEHIPYIVENRFRDWKDPSKLPGTGGTTYRLKAIKEAGGFDENLQGSCEDIDAAYRMTQAGWLIIRGNSFFEESHEGLSTFGALWKRSLKRGETSRRVYNKNTVFFSVYRMNPLASFVAGVRYGIIGYLLTKKKVSFLLPFFYAFKSTAWFLGFTRSRSQKSQVVQKSNRLLDKGLKKLVYGPKLY